MSSHCDANCTRCRKSAKKQRLSLVYEFRDCAFGGFFTKIPLKASVLHLMKQIKAEHPDFVTCPVAEMNLFVLHKRDDLPSRIDFGDVEIEDEYEDNPSDYDPDVCGMYRAEITPMRRTRILRPTFHASKFWATTKRAYLCVCPLTRYQITCSMTFQRQSKTWQS